MNTVKQVKNYRDVMFNFPPKLRYFAEVEAAGGALFCSYDGGKPTGIICLKDIGAAFDTAYLFVNEAYRRQGIAKSLVGHACDYVKTKGCNLHLRVVENSNSALAVAKIAQGMDMRPSKTMTFFRMEVNAKSKKLWEEACPKIMEMVEKIDKKKGPHHVIPFEEADDGLIGRLRSMVGNELPGLDPFALPDFDTHFSLIIMHGGEIEAVNAVRMIGRKMVYEISAARKGSTILAGVPVFFDRLFASEIEIVSCMVYNDNHEGMNHVSKRFGFLFKESGRQTVYISNIV